MNLGLDGRVAIVTGASRGLGRAAVLALAAEGAKVLAVARSTDALDAVAAEAPDGSVVAATCDMRDRAQVAALADLAVERFGRLDVVVNNAGIAPAGRFVDLDDDVWQEVFEVNVFAPVTLARAAGRHFLEQGSGKVINIASTSGILGKPTLVAYSSSKGAVLQFTKALAGEWAGKGIQVNAIAPGAYETDAQSAVLESDEILKRRLRKIPAGRMGDPAEIGPLVCLLASSASDFVTGSVLVADGGESSKL
ncbi:SDR family NAD(P)-dependent oxidoreductase [Patulibacter sp.]|uniref:SDR family NAD(P)-dependent oxidoreductase n=1 Tax=Patulibacter sp. TaxID=1912859 RepID=UPI0027266257|nr:SDR family oxidoreductase [Patulibacter sp.]MDO9408884.1 SDR family oxidoreductase [Patulibacter sp.]